LLRELAGKAYEAELRRALVPLAEAFEAWRSGKVGSGDLVERIHAFDQGPARELFVKYNRSRINFAVAHAVTTGILRREDIPPEVLDHLAGALEFYGSPEGGS
jgi:hypothetical protein